MAVSLGFGVLFATGITLFLVPCSLLVGEDFGRAMLRFKQWYVRPFQPTPSASGDQALARQAVSPPAGGR
jgi:hypothetical protein